MRRAELSGGGWREVLGRRTGETAPANVYEAPSTSQEGPTGNMWAPRQANNFMWHQADIHSLNFNGVATDLCSEGQGRGQRRGPLLAILHPL